MKQKIRDYLDSCAPGCDIHEIDDNASLLEAGVLDSLMMVDLVTHLENTYNISVDEDDMIPENFDSIDFIAQYVDRKKSQIAN